MAVFDTAALPSGLDAHRTVLHHAPLDVRDLVDDLAAWADLLVDVRVTSSTTSGRPGTEGDTWLRFEVADTGVGIAAERLPRLFEPFTRSDPRDSGDRQGNGLGLAIASELAHLTQGQLGVESTPGEGSTFTFGVSLGPVGLEDSVR